MKIILLGFMGCGKSTIGKKLAAKLGYTFYDLDNEIERSYNISISEIFEKFGESQFRKIETEALMSTLQIDNIVLSCGGGTACYNNNMKTIKELGCSIYIKMNAKSLANRLLHSSKKRPLVSNTPDCELLAKTETLLYEREVFYSMADYTIQGLNLCAEDIILLLDHNKLKV